MTKIRFAIVALAITLATQGCQNNAPNTSKDTKKASAELSASQKLKLEEAKHKMFVSIFGLNKSLVDCGLKGKICTIKTEKFSVKNVSGIAKEHLETVEIDSYSTEGYYLINRVYNDQNKLIEWGQTLYDGKRDTSNCQYTDGMKLKYKDTKEYNKIGQLVNLYLHNVVTGKANLNEHFEYDSSGNISKIFNYNGIPADSFWYKDSLIFNEYGLITCKYATDYSKRFAFKDVRCYDNDFRIIIDSTCVNGRFFNSRKFNYSNDGTEIATITYDSLGKAKDEKLVQIFDKNNSLIEELFVNVGTAKKGKDLKRTIKEYEYDNIGNVVKTLTYTVRDGKKELTEIEKKTIVYYK